MRLCLYRLITSIYFICFAELCIADFTEDLIAAGSAHMNTVSDYYPDNEELLNAGVCAENCFRRAVPTGVAIDGVANWEYLGAISLDLRSDASSEWSFHVAAVIYHPQAGEFYIADSLET